jgi:hypothetical protein
MLRRKILNRFNSSKPHGMRQAGGSGHPACLFFLIVVDRIVNCENLRFPNDIGIQTMEWS